MGFGKHDSKYLINRQVREGARERERGNIKKLLQTTKTVKIEWPSLIINTLKTLTHTFYMLLPMSKPYPFLYILWRTIINFTLRLRYSCKSGEATIRVTVATYWLSLCASNKSYKCQKYDHKNLHHKFL